MFQTNDIDKLAINNFDELGIIKKCVRIYDNDRGDRGGDCVFCLRYRPVNLFSDEETKENG